MGIWTVTRTETGFAATPENGAAILRDLVKDSEGLTLKALARDIYVADREQLLAEGVLEAHGGAPAPEIAKGGEAASVVRRHVNSLRQERWLK